MNLLKRFLAGVIVLSTAGSCLAQTPSAGATTSPTSASDQQIQAKDLTGKRGQDQVDLFTGSFGYSLPIAVAPARNGSEPALALAYSSGGENDWCGVGWKLDIGYIERNTKDGVPIKYSTATPPAPTNQYDNTKGFILNLFGRELKLLPTATTNEFDAEVDTDFLRCMLDTANNRWLVYDKSGNVYSFGQTSGSKGSRVDNSKPGWSGYTATFHWALDQIVTASGDWTTIAYTNYTSPFTGQPEKTLYPTQITYNGHTNFNNYSATVTGQHTISFQTELRPNDWHFSYRWGFRTEYDRRLTNVVCQVGSQNVWRYGLRYGTSKATDRSLLTNVIVSGFDAANGAAILLTNTFAYQGAPVSFGATTIWTNLNLAAPDGGGYDPYVTQVNFNGGVGDTIADLVDIDGDGLPDRICWDDSTATNKYQVQRNLGNGSFGPRFSFSPTSSGHGITASATNPIPDAVEWSALNAAHMRFRDINGDGLPDRVCDYWNYVNNGPNTYTNFEVMLNTGTNFATVAPWAVSDGPTNAATDLHFYQCVESGGVNAGFFDINGDGLPDRVLSMHYSEGPMINFRVQFNTGTNFSPIRLFGPYHSQNYNNYPTQSEPYTWAGIETPYVHMADLNGDGLPDRIMLPLNPASPVNPVTYAARTNFAVEYNDGYSFEAINTNTTSVPGAADLWPGVDVQTTSVDYAEIQSPPLVGLYDMNGDGLPDRVMLDNSTYNSTTSKSWLVYLNNGHSFDTTPVTVANIEFQGQGGDPGWWGMQGISFSSTIVTLLDINGDGLLDRVMSVFNNVSSSNYFLVELNNGPFPDLLTNINNGIGGTIGVAYKSSTAYPNYRDQANTNSGSLMPFPKQTVSALTESDGINPARTTAYGYVGGFYDAGRREFAGFAMVTITNPPSPISASFNRRSVHYFHQGGGQSRTNLGEYLDPGNFAKKGIAYRTETYGNDNNLYSVIVNQVDQAALGNGRYFPFVQLTFDCDYPGGGTPKVTATKFAYDPATGNLTNQIVYGEVTGFNPTNVGGFSFSDAAAADTQSHNISYASISANADILDHPDTVSLTDTGNNVVRETKFTYNSSSGTLAAKLTRISSSAYATNSYGSYNSYGLPTTTTDPVGVQTTIAYDSAYNIYPATTTVGTLITTTSYDARSGLVAAVTDISGVTVTNSYDAFCRPIESDRIPAGGSSNIWIKKFSYPATLKPITSGTATNYTDVISNDGVGGFTNRTYIDGFGKPIQTRTQGQNGNFRVVSTAYDERGAAFLTTWPIFGASISFSKPTTGQTASWTGFDAAGRAATNYTVTLTVDGNGAFSNKVSLGGEANSPLGTNTWSYVNNGDPWWKISTDADGAVRRYQLDAFGRNKVIQEVDGASTYTTTLNYDLAGNLTNIVNANGENIYYAYDDAGSMVAMADPYLGRWTYQRDYAGRLRVQTDARMDVVKLYYTNPANSQQDPLGRVCIKEVYSTNYTTHTLTLVSTVTNIYDTSDDNNFTVYPGLLYKTIDSQGWQKNGYDSRVRLARSMRHLNLNNKDYTNNYTYDDGDNLTSLAYPNGGPVITNTYFHGGSLNQVSRSGGYNFYTANAASYDEFGHVTNFVYGNTLTTTRSFYPVSKRLQTISSGSSGSVFSRSYQYSAGEDITFLNGSGVTNVTVTYDNLHRIKTYTGLSGSYGYDAVGNISSSIEGGGSGYSYVSPRTQAVRTAFGYTNLYDLCGNMIVRHGGTTNAQALQYDPENRLTAFAQAGTVGAEFGYAGDGTRLWKRVNQNPTNVQVWIGNIYEEKGGRTLFHVFAGGQQVCTFETNSILAGGTDTNKVGYYYHEDSLNSSSALSDSSGTQKEVNAFYPFGRTQTASPQAGFKVSRQFTGQIKDDESGLYYYNARYFDPELGRFIQPDTDIPDMSNPQSYNRYSYVMNNPLRYTDPNGHRPLTSAEQSALKGMGTLQSAVSAQHKEFADSVGAFVKDFSAKVSAVPTGQKDPANLAIASSAITIWNSGNAKYNRERGKEQDTSVEGLTTLSKTIPINCNYFVAEAIQQATDEKLGKTSWSGNVWPPAANTYSTPEKDKRLKNFSTVATTEMGDIISFPQPGDSGHVGVALGHGLYVSARTGDVPGTSGKNPIQPFSGVQVKDIPTDELHVTIRHN